MLKAQFLLVFIIFNLLLLSCDSNTSKSTKKTIIETTIASDSTSPIMTKNINIQGHRGCRGLRPENTIPAFIKALELGITTLELDVVVTKDKQVVVSHEPWLSHEICTDKNGVPITEDNERAYNIYAMTYEELKNYNCGGQIHKRFPDQEKMNVTKPRLVDLIDSVRSYCQQHQISKVWYNIEIKRTPEYDNIFCPPVEEFVDLVLEVLNEKAIVQNCNLQSFDWEVLRLCNQKAPDIPLAMLVENELSPQANLDSLGFTPEIYSCYFKLIDKELLNWVKTHKMQLIPWTVNEEEDIEAMLKLPLDGIITDYPDRVQAIQKK